MTKKKNHNLILKEDNIEVGEISVEQAREKSNKEIEIISTQRNRLSDCVRYSLDKECITLEEVQNFLDTDTDSINNWIFCY